MVGIVIPSLKWCVKTVSSITCPVPYSLVVARSEGVAHARNEGAKQVSDRLLVMFDDDLVLEPEIWNFLLGLQRREFAMCLVTGHISTRVFACWTETFWSLKGFDESIRYVWEDGDFYRRAIQAGLNFRLVPPNLYRHEEHISVRMVNKVRAFKTGWEWSKHFARYNRWVEPNMLDFFVDPIRKKHPRDVIFKFGSLLYWLTIGRLT